jgi:uncharacterized membrane protein
MSDTGPSSSGPTPPPLPPGQNPAYASPPVPPTQPGAIPGPVGRPDLTPQEISDGKAMAVVSYVCSLIGLPFFLVPLIMRDNGFSLYHAKQCLVLWLVLLVAATLLSPLVFCGVGLIALPVLIIFAWVCDIMGIIRAANGDVKPLPLIGGWGERWFAGIRVNKPGA